MAYSPQHSIRQGPLEAYVSQADGLPDFPWLAAQVSGRAPCVWLDSARTHPVTGRWSLFGWDPWLTLTARPAPGGRPGGALVTLRTSRSVHRWRADPLAALRPLLRRYAGPRWGAEGPLGLGLVGWLSYDANRWIERLPTPRRTEPAMPELAWQGLRVTVLADHLRQRRWIVSVVDPHEPASRARRRAWKRLEQAQDWLEHPGPAPNAMPCGGVPEVTATSSPAAFEAMVARALEYIRRGDIFQANLAQRFAARWNGSPLSLYLRLRAINPSPFACFLQSGPRAIVSCSPERLVRVQDRWVDARPIAGTRARGATPGEDALAGLELLMSDKERAEHIMLVDLARNDLGRLCEPGSISVDELMALEEYSHVIHIVSNVSGRVRAATDAVAVIRALFPGGTITGCPKVRAMEIIRELEPVGRGLYTGSIGWLGFDGSLDLNIAIRTILLDGPRLSYHVGAGIVADSQPDREYAETLAKAQALIAALRAQATNSHALAR